MLNTSARTLLDQVAGARSTRVAVTVVVSAMLALSASAPSLASTTGTVDQTQDNPGTAGASLGWVPNNIEIAQSFTVGRTGLLTRVDVLVASDGPSGVVKAAYPLSVSVVDATGGIPSGPALTAGSIDPSVPDGTAEGYTAAGTDAAWVDVELSPPLPVVVGDKLAIMASAEYVDDGHGSWIWWGLEGNAYPNNQYLGLDLYPGGLGMGLDSFHPWMPLEAAGFHFDFGFRTYVDSSPTCSWSRIRQPVNAVDSASDPNVSGFKFGSRGVVPAKFQLTCEGDLVDTQEEADAVGPAVLSLHASLDGGAEVEFLPEALVTGSANTGSEFRFDDDSNQFIYNIAIKGMKRGAYRIAIEGAGDTQVEFFRIV